MRTPYMPFLVLLLAIAGCGGGSSSRSGEQTYDIKGKVVAIDAAKDKQLTLDHEDIPGLMPAMKMPFKVADPKILEGLKPGDHVKGRVKKSGSGIVITALEKVGGGTNRSGEQTYDIKGKVVAIDTAKDRPLTLDHEDIPGLMKAMQMPFKVADPKLLEGLKPSDHVKGRVKKTDSGLVITSLEKSSAGTGP